MAEQVFAKLVKKEQLKQYDKKFQNKLTYHPLYLILKNSG